MEARATGIPENVDRESGVSTRRRIRDAMVAAGIAESYNERTGELTENARVVLQRRYLSKDREGNVLEDPDGMFRRVAQNLSQSDLEYGATEAERAATEDSVLPSDASPGISAQLTDPDECGPGVAAAISLLRVAR